MGLSLNGIGVSKGIAIGKAYVLKNGASEINEYIVPRLLIPEEVTRYRTALKKAKQQLQKVRKQIPVSTPGDIVAFIDAHVLMLEDTALSAAPIKIIKEQQCNAEWALKLQRDALIDVFEAMDDPYLKMRKDDVDHVINRIHENLHNESSRMVVEKDQWLKGCVVIAYDLAPAQILQLQNQGAAAFVTEYGGPTSHTAILAKSLGIPVIVGIHDVHNYIHHDEMLVVDAHNGILLAGVERSIVDVFRKQQRKEKYHLVELNKLKNQPAVTKDNQTVMLMANMEFPEDVPAIKRVSADAIGLYRTEMLFMNRNELPDEEEQFQSYKHVVKAMKGSPVTIRTLDIGMDKHLDGHGYDTGQSGVFNSNPALGLRAIRLCLKDSDMFRTQIRAILRTSAFGSVRMMVPMLSTISELLQVLNLVEEEKNTLSKQGVKFNAGMPVGGMIEVPAAALAADVFARHLDFLSIGTNDLIQYTLAVDRLDDEVNYLYDPLHPSILRLISMVIEAGQKAEVPVAMCGEMAGDTRYTKLLLGMGLREFSMYPASLLEVKRIVNSSDTASLSKNVIRLLKMSMPEEIAALIDKINLES